MVDIIKGLFDLSAIFINWLFNLKVEFIGETQVSLGVITISFLFFVTVLYLILKALGYYDGKE